MASVLQSQSRPSGPRIRVGIVEDQPLFREMLQATLRGVSAIQVVTAVDGVAAAMQMIQPGSVDVAILDIDLPDGNGIALGVRLRRADPRIGILLLSAHDAMSLLLDLPADVKTGWSYLSKTSTTSTQILVDAIQRTAMGLTVLDAKLLRRSVPRAGTALASLTDRQYEVLRLLAEGLSNAGIAEELNITGKSVQNHINAIYNALDIDSDPQHNPRVTAALRLIEESGSVID